MLGDSLVEPGLWNKLYRRELLERLIKENKLDISIRINEDLLMNYYLFKYSSFSIYEDFCPYHYVLRKNSAATSKVNENKLKDPLKVRKIIKDDCSNCSDLLNIVDSDIVRQLICLSTYSYRINKDIVKPYVNFARNELHSKLNYYIHSDISTKLKISALWVAIWPASYKFVHYIYAKVKGLDKKYEVS